MSLAVIKTAFPVFCEGGIFSSISRLLRRRLIVNCASCRQAQYSTGPSNSEHSAAKVQSEDDYVNPVFVNRNPRNLEFLGIARKRKGWRFQYPSVHFYHRLIFEKSKRYLSAYVEHTSGKIVISASTKEYAICKHLYSPNDKAAAENLGRILAQRCKEAGIVNMIELPQEGSGESGKYGEFIKAITANGIELGEPEEVLPDYEPGIDYDDEFEYGDLLRRQALVRDTESKIRKLRRLRSHKKLDIDLVLQSQNPLYEQRTTHPRWNTSKWSK